MKRALPIVTIIFLLTLLGCGGAPGATPTGRISTPAALPPTQVATKAAVGVTTAPAKPTIAPTKPTTAPATVRGTTGPSTTAGATSSAYPSPGAVGTSGTVVAPEFVTLTVTQTSSLGSFLVDQNGRTVYLFLNDTGTASTCYGNCAQVWPPVIASKAAMAGMNVDQNLISTTTRTDGTTQVTYNGHPLYYFNKDTKSGQTNGQGVNGFGNLWYVVSPTGDAIKK